MVGPDAAAGALHPAGPAEVGREEHRPHRGHVALAALGALVVAHALLQLQRNGRTGEEDQRRPADQQHPPQRVRDGVAAREKAQKEDQRAAHADHPFHRQ